MESSPPLSSNSRTRRQVIGWGSAGVVAGVAGYFSIPSADEPVIETAAAPAKPAVAKPEPLPAVAHAQAFSRYAFMPHLNTEFTFQHNADARAACQLIDVSPAKVLKTGKGDFSAFTLLFAAHRDFLKAGGTCRVQHPQLAEMEFFLTPVGDGKKRHLLEACFTQRV